MNQQTIQERREIFPPPALTLFEVDPTTIIEGERVGERFFAPDPRIAGPMRESCPFCEDVHLQLILRQERVKMAHLFCPKCTRCFDARYPDGSEALNLF